MMAPRRLIPGSGVGHARGPRKAAAPANDPGAQGAPARTGPRRAGSRRRAPMSLALGVVLGGFVLLAVASVMGVGLWSGYRSTLSLLAEKGEVMLGAAERETRRYLDAAEGQAAFVAGMIESGEVVPSPREDFTSLLAGALAAAPQIQALLYLDAEGNVVGAERDADTRARPVFRRIGDDDALARLLASRRTADAGAWEGLVWREDYGQALLSYARPLHMEGSFAGALVAFVSLHALSEFIADLEGDFGTNAFVLYGRDQVLAHPLMAFDFPGLSGLMPLPRQATFSDPVLASLWEPAARTRLAAELFDQLGGHAIQLGGETYGILYREIPGYAEAPLLIGTYFRSAELVGRFAQLKWAVATCLLLLVAAVWLATVAGRRIATPVRRLAEAARRVQDLDLGTVPRVPGSFFKELNDAAESFNAMRDGLVWFERYVPRSLVVRLMQNQQPGALESAEREVTVMFTDIIGFTARSENLPAGRLAALLNRHVTLVADCIEAEGGTVDKYIGDSVMAVWGAPEEQPDAPLRAMRAARAIDAALRRENAARRRRCQRPICVRIGIHSGPVVVGNIGSPGRINYTVVGDTVNTAQRLVELARAADGPGTAATVLVSGEVARHPTAGLELSYVGLRRVRGRNRLIDVYALDARAPDAAGLEAAEPEASLRRCPAA